MDDQLRKPYQGQLIKFTNVVKGWQARWFVLNPEHGSLHYFLSENEFPSRVRGSIQLAGAVISPSDEDSLTFTVSPAAGEAYKLRAQDTKDRQMWLNRLRVIAEMHTRAIAHHHPPLAPREHRVPGTNNSNINNSSGGANLGHHISSTNSISSTLSTHGGGGSVSFQGGGGGGAGTGRGLAVLDAFTQVSELLQEAHRHHTNLATAVEDLPSHGRGMKCSDPNLLLLKATSQATVTCLDNCLSVLKSQQHSNIYQQQQIQQRPRQHSPSLRSSSPSLRTRTAPHSPVPSHHLMNINHCASRGPSNSSTSIHIPLTQSNSLNSPIRNNLKDARTSSSQNLAVKDPVNDVDQQQTNMVRSTPNLEQNSSENVSNETRVEMSIETPAKIITSAVINREESIVSQNSIAKDLLPTISARVLLGPRLPGPSCSDSEESESDSTTLRRGSTEDNGGDEDQTQHSVIMHIISQLRLGMDLTRVTLPTFILEKRSLLEMFADFLGHPDYFIKIADCTNSKERLLAVMRWYLSSVHVGRKGATAKKPYNPIIGETFQCSWRVPVKSKKTLQKMDNSNSSNIEAKDYVSIKFAAEQVSHHPPVSAFYFECPEKQLCINAHIWTKSKFMGISVGVNLVGDITLTVGNCQDNTTVSNCTSPEGSMTDSDSVYVNCDSSSEVSVERSKKETYTLSMPSAFARSILMEPWAELGGRVNINCVESGWTAPVVFHTKPFYGGCLHRISGEVKEPNGSVVCKVSGEWDGAMELNHTRGDMEILDVKSMPMVCQKRVRPIRTQGEGESRRLWQDVSLALSRHDLDTATAHKRRLEDMQRTYEAGRRSRGEKFIGRLFESDGVVATAVGGGTTAAAPEEGLQHWIYRKLPPYVTNPCVNTE